MVAYDVAVVGAGIVGCAVARECAARGARTVLLDRGEPGGQASGAAAGMLAPCSEAHAAGPFLALTRRSLERWPAFAAAIGEVSGVDCELVLDGLLRVAIGPADVGPTRERLAWQVPLGVDARWLDADAVAEVEPAAVRVAGAVWYPGEGHVHSPRAVRALVGALRGLGGEVRRGVEVTGAAPGGLRLAGGEELRAATVVVAAGCWSGHLSAALGGRPLPVRPVRGQLVALRGLPRTPRRVLFAGPAGYACAKRDGLLLVGATEEDAGFDPRITAAATERLLAAGRCLVRDIGDATLVTAWAGLRPAAPDLLPVLGELEVSGRAAPRLLVATGHHRNGVLLAPATAEGMARLALEGAAPQDWGPFDPRRFD